MNRTIQDDKSFVEAMVGPDTGKELEYLLPRHLSGRTIEHDAQHALQMLNLDISDVLLSRGSRSIMNKKKLLYCYLRLECGYSWHEIGTYCNKDHTTILKVVNKHLIKYRAFSHKLKQTISE